MVFVLYFPLISVSEEEELAFIAKKVKDIDVKLVELKAERDMLLKRREKLNSDIMRKKSENLAKRNWAQTGKFLYHFLKLKCPYNVSIFFSMAMLLKRTVIVVKY